MSAPSQVKHTVMELLRVYLRGKMPLKSDGQIGEVLKKRMAGHVLPDEWADIVRYMYLESDAQMLIRRIQEAAASARSAAVHGVPPPLGTPRALSSSRGARSDRADDGRLPYSSFLQVLLDFQLSGHVAYLSSFVSLFQQLDPLGRGFVNEAELRQLALALDPGKTEEELVALLERADPHNHQRIAFSDTVQLFADELQRLNAGQADEGGWTELQ